MTSQPEVTTLLTSLADGVLSVTLNRPDRRNALSPRMIDELIAVFTSVAGKAQVQAIVLRGAGGSFCAGADIKEMSAAAAAAPVADPKAAIARNNRRYGELVCAVQAATQPVVAVIEGVVLGGGIGLVCASDIALCLGDSRFGLPETGLGLIPAQIAPFVVQRIGLTQARRLMLTGARFDGTEAARIGLTHQVCADVSALEAALAGVLAQIRRCAPGANAATKRLLFATLGRDLGGVLDEASQVFAEASLSEEAREGTMAFLQKRLPKWAS